MNNTRAFLVSILSCMLFAACQVHPTTTASPTTIASPKTKLRIVAQPYAQRGTQEITVVGVNVSWPGEGRSFMIDHPLTTLHVDYFDANGRPLSENSYETLIGLSAEFCEGYTKSDSFFLELGHLSPQIASVRLSLYDESSEKVSMKWNAQTPSFPIQTSSTGNPDAH